jgi:two-component system response regulator CpxR
MNGQVSAGVPTVATSLLLVDDDTGLCELMTEFFGQHGFQVQAVHNGRDGLAKALDGKFDLVILDGMLPVLDGFEVLRQLRRRSSIPVVMLTARTERTDRIAGLDAGADDYLPKPFGPDELLARIRAVLRRSGQQVAPKQALHRIGPLEVNPQTRRASIDTNVLELTAMQFDILEMLIRSAGRVVSRDELAAAIHQREATPFERSLDVHISHLRKKLENTGAPAIRTIRGSGYLLTADSE